MTDIIDAIKNRDVARVTELLDEDPAAADAHDENGVSALMLAYYHGLRDAADAIRAHRGEIDVFEAATVGDTARLQALLDEDPSSTTAWSVDRGTPLHFASFFGRPETARILLERGADVHAVSPTFGNVTPLHSAAAAPSLEIVRMLLEAGADANATQSGGFTALHAAAQNGDPEMARILIEHGARESATDDGRTARSIADEQGHADVAALLDEAAG